MQKAQTVYYQEIIHNFGHPALKEFYRVSLENGVTTQYADLDRLSNSLQKKGDKPSKNYILLWHDTCINAANHCHACSIFVPVISLFFQGRQFFRDFSKQLLKVYFRLENFLNTYVVALSS